jgi:NADPH-dependent curcumin reductase CurA
MLNTLCSFTYARFYFCIWIRQYDNTTAKFYHKALHLVTYTSIMFHDVIIEEARETVDI